MRVFRPPRDWADGALLFVDGPLALYIREAPEEDILDAYERLGKLVAVAAKQLAARADARFEASLHAYRPATGAPDDSGGSPDKG